MLKVTCKKKYSFKATVTNALGKRVTGSDGKVTWTTSNKNIASVTSGGKVTVKRKTGTVTITAKSADGTTAKVKLKAGRSSVKATKVTVTAESKTMELNDKDSSQVLKAVVKPASASNRKVVWKSSNKKIAAVNSKGKVIAKKAGTVKITRSEEHTSELQSH